MPAAATAAGAVALAAVAFGNPYTGGWFPPCPLHAATGLWCPGCGSTRATHELLHANIAGAFTLNPLLVIAAPVMLYLYVRWFARSTTGRRLPMFRPTAKWNVAIGMLLIGFAVARNLPYGAVAWMAP